MSIGERLYSRPWLMAGLVTATVLLWLASGFIGERKHDDEAAGGSISTQSDMTRVQVAAQQAQLITRYISVFGRTAPARVVEIKAETNGRIESLGAARGQQVPRGTVMLRLDLRDRQARLQEAEASVAQHQTAYEGQLELKAQGYVSETQIAETLAKLEAAKAELTRARLDLDYMTIRAPFDGVILERMVEQGDFVRAGDPVLTFVDNTKLIVTASIAEQDAGYVSVGSSALAKLVTGEEARGRIRYLAPVAEESTRTFTVELELQNADGRLPAGVTAEMEIPAGDMLAHKVSPAILSLAADGRIGVMTVDPANQVVFNEIQIARSAPDGVWITGLPQAANIIVVGQGYVSAGQEVEPVFADRETALAADRLREGSLQ
jgi:multidrug efflux system membrane fusion protein